MLAGSANERCTCFKSEYARTSLPATPRLGAKTGVDGQAEREAWDQQKRITAEPAHAARPAATIELGRESPQCRRLPLNRQTTLASAGL